MPVDLQILNSRFSLERALRGVLRFLRISRGSWTVKVVGDAEMAELHERTLGVRGTTDVLTFDLRDPPAGKNHTSQITNHRFGALELDTVVCVDEARRRADELGHGVGEELLLYCVHSLLHVQGYDDVTAAGARRMHAREDEVLRGIGVGAVYGGEVKSEKFKIKNRKNGGRA